MAKLLMFPWSAEVQRRHLLLVGEGIDLADQRLTPSADRRNIVALVQVRELREFAKAFAAYRYPTGPEAA